MKVRVLFYSDRKEFKKKHTTHKIQLKTKIGKPKIKLGDRIVEVYFLLFLFSFFLIFIKRFTKQSFIYCVKYLYFYNV